MTKTWTGTARPWLVPVVVACGVAAMLAILWAAFWWASPAIFSASKGTAGLGILKIIAVVICLLFAWTLVRIVQANAPNTVTLGDGQVTVWNSRGEHVMKLADVDAIVYVTTSVQSGAGLFFYPREEHLAATGSRVRYGNADPDMTISLQRFTNHDERECALALRAAVKAAGGRFGTSTGTPTEEDDGSATRAPGRLRVARPVIRRDDTKAT